MRFTFPAIAALLITLAACSSAEVDPTTRWSAEEFYRQAKTMLDNNNWGEAINLYSKLEARYPYGPYTEQGQLETAFAHYKNDEPAAAIAAAERFIKLHPRHANVDYAYYLRGLASFEQGRSLINDLFDQDMAERDPTPLRQSFDYFRELLVKFPESRYAADAEQRMVFLRNSLAKHEIYVADYYLRRGAPLAAVNRAKFVLETYPQTPAVADALVMMVRGYRQLGLTDLADDALQLLRLNYPGHAIPKEGAPAHPKG